MAITKFKYLESLPIDERNLSTSANPESNLLSKSCFNLGFNITNSISKFKNIIKINLNHLEEKQGLNQYLDLAYFLESMIINLLNYSGINDIKSTVLFPHYLKRNSLVSNTKVLPNSNYCKNLLFTKFKVWGGVYGSPLYYLFLEEEYEEYRTPSELVYYSTKAFIKYSNNLTKKRYADTKIESYKQLEQVYNRFNNLIDDDSLNADKLLYDVSKSFITEVTSIRNTYLNLLFYKKWLPIVLSYFVDNNVRYIELPKNNKEAATNTLILIAKRLLEQGIYINSFTNIDLSFIFQYNVNRDTFKAIDSIKRYRKESIYNPNIIQEFTSIEEDLMKEFFTNISLNDIDDLYKESNEVILECFGPPSGYVMIQLFTTLNLLNRAYILSYKEARLEKPIILDDKYTRILNLIIYAGLILIKTGISSFQAEGKNLLVALNIELENIDPSNLLDR